MVDKEHQAWQVINDRRFVVLNTSRRCPKYQAMSEIGQMNTFSLYFLAVGTTAVGR